MAWFSEIEVRLAGCGSCMRSSTVMTLLASLSPPFTSAVVT